MTDTDLDTAPGLVPPSGPRPAIRIREPRGGERRLAAAMRRDRWRLAEARLGNPGIRRIVTVDEQLVASISGLPGRLRDFDRPPAVSTTTDRLAAGIEADADGDWLLKTGLFYDARRPGSRPRARERLADRAGPLWASLVCRRRRMTGYVAAVALRGQPRLAPALDPAAYLQQVGAGDLDEPLLAAHLEYGARPVALVCDTPFPLAVVRWRR